MLDIKRLNIWKKSKDGSSYCICGNDEKTFENDTLENVKDEDFTFVNYTFKNIIFKNVIFEDSFIDECIFINCNFIDCEFIKSEFRWCKFDKCNFENCKGDIKYIRASTFKKNCIFTDSIIKIEQIDEYIYINSKRYGFYDVITHLCK